MAGREAKLLANFICQLGGHASKQEQAAVEPASFFYNGYLLVEKRNSVYINTIDVVAI